MKGITCYRFLPLLTQGANLDVFDRRNRFIYGHQSWMAKSIIPSFPSAYYGCRKNASLMHGELRVGHQWKNILILRCVSSINGLVCFHLSSLLAGTQSPASFINASSVVKLASSLYVKTLISAMLRRPRNIFFSILCFFWVVCGFCCWCIWFYLPVSQFFHQILHLLEYFPDLWHSE